MRHVKLVSAVYAVAISMLGASRVRAVYTYNFDSLPGSAAPGTPLVDGTTAGTVGLENWVLTSGVTSYVRNDPPGGFTGNYAQGVPVDAASPNTGDSILSRIAGDYGALGLGGAGTRYITLQFDGRVGFSHNNSSGAPVYRRSELIMGVDTNANGKIRGTAASSENNEAGPQFGYDATGGVWYLRRAAFSNTDTRTVAATNVSGVYRFQLVIDLQANQSTVADQANPGAFVFDGAGSLYVKKIADEAGNLVDDVFRLPSETLANMNMGLSAMGGGGAANPANWNGYFIRTASNGGVDNLNFFNGLPTNTSSWASNAGNWNALGNWYIGVPNAVDAVAELGIGATTSSTVYSDTNITLGTLRFAGSNAYNLTGNGSLTLQTSSGSAAIEVQSGAHKVNLPLVIASNTTLDTAAGATLRISDPVTVNAGRSVTQTGAGTVLYESTINILSGGSLAVANSFHAAGLTLADGATATVNAPSGGGTSVIQLDALSLGAGSALDLKTNELRYVAAESSTLADLAAGRITTSSATPNRKLGYAAIAGGQVRALYTVIGDTNLDKLVNFSDLLTLAQNYGASSGKFWKHGDLDYNGGVNFGDLLALAQNYGGTLSAAQQASIGEDFFADFTLAQSLVPEPATLGVFGGAAMLLAAARRRTR